MAHPEVKALIPALPHAVVLILAILVAVRIALAIAFQTAGLAAPFLVAEWGLDYAAAGGLVGLFWVPGLLLALPAASIGRRFGERRMVAVGLLLMALGVALSASANGQAIFAAGRLVIGAGAALLMALLMKMVADWCAGKLIFLGMSCFILGWPVGIAGTQVLLGAAAELSWRAALLAGAAAIALIAVIFALGYRAPPGGAATDAAGLRINGQEAWLVSLAGAAWTIVNGAYLVLVTFGPVLLAERDAAAIPLAGPEAAGPLFLLHGFAYAFGGPYLSTQPLQALRPATRASGLGLYYLWFYAGCTALPPVAGWLKDVHGPEAPIVFAVVLLLVTGALMGAFAVELRRLRRR